MTVLPTVVTKSSNPNTVLVNIPFAVDEDGVGADNDEEAGDEIVRENTSVSGAIV